MSHMDSPERKDWQKAQNAAARALLETVPLHPQPDGSHGIKVEYVTVPKTPEMVERVARAICSALGEGPDATEEHCLPGSYQTDDGEPHWRGYIEHAKAAIEASCLHHTRDTELGMAGHAAIFQEPPDFHGAAVFIDGWNAVIDTALKEPDPA